ncbi:MAG TPA: dihydroorotase [Petrimonas sp.]|uniref:dihydroorotase n=1 Tax=Petrimonas sp. TaxID=2023866 RepID=UPI000961CEF7|nr:dihydroorotase [Petrimonas sp.]MEA5043840.1 dihydroorotase [Petrimonas sp.]MEA5063038.1 dihydroorotase [Petrimonas sp.]OJV37209.1 MAG: dihydroorotase [Bacteroidia bacterium 43-41]HHV87004.1 dihydroorotase [Petrimonas sp.]
MKLIHKATLINEGRSFIGSVLVEGERISKVFEGEVPENVLQQCCEIIDARGLYLIPGVIDDQVHFRDPGLTHKGDIYTESRAAVAGGVTSFMEMPNTNPQTVTLDALRGKFDLAAQKSIANYSFYLGATNDNIKELIKVDKRNVCGVKVFMGASTGNMLVDNAKTLQRIFAEVDSLIATHCEKEEIIRDNIGVYKKQFGEDIPIQYHPLIRSEEACYRSSVQAAGLADKYGSRLHVLHLSTAREMSLFSSSPVKDKKITSEVCVHHLWFTDEDYARLGARIKWNPAVKTRADRDALRSALKSGKLDIVATDHAPHLLSEKEGGCLKAASGGPLVQHSLQVMLELSLQGLYSKEFVVEKMCHAPADLFQVKGRGFIREGYFADLVLINPDRPYAVGKDNILYKCGWSPFEGEIFRHSIEKTFVNGNLVFDNGHIVESAQGKALIFDR